MITCPHSASAWVHTSKTIFSLSHTISWRGCTQLIVHGSGQALAFSSRQTGATLAFGPPCTDCAPTTTDPRPSGSRWRARPTSWRPRLPGGPTQCLSAGGCCPDAGRRLDSVGGGKSRLPMADAPASVSGVAGKDWWRCDVRIRGCVERKASMGVLGRLAEACSSPRGPAPPGAASGGCLSGSDHGA